MIRLQDFILNVNKKVNGTQLCIDRTISILSSWVSTKNKESLEVLLFKDENVYPIVHYDLSAKPLLDMHML